MQSNSLTGFVTVATNPNLILYNLFIVHEVSILIYNSNLKQAPFQVHHKYLNLLQSSLKHNHVLANLITCTIM